MLSYFYGSDTYGARQAIGEMALALTAEIRRLSAEDFGEQGFGTFLDQSRGLLGTTLMIVQDPSGLPANIQEEIIKLHESPQKFLGAVWERGEPDKRSRLFKALSKGARVFPKLEPPQAVTWLESEAVRQKGKMNRAAAQKLVSFLGMDRWRLLSELQRLLLIADEAEITPEIVEHEVAPNRLGEIFPALDALASGHVADALNHIQLLLTQGETEIYILSMLAYQFRMLLFMKTGLEAGRNMNQIAREAGFSPFALEKNAAAARRLSRADILNAQTKITATDFAIKRGKLEPRTALLMMVPGLIASSRK